MGYVIKNLEINTINLFKQVEGNQINANKDKCNLIVTIKQNVSVHIGLSKIKSFLTQFKLKVLMKSLKGYKLILK